MNAKAMYNIKEMLCTDLDQYARKGGLTKNDLEAVNRIMDTIKNIDKISMMEEEGSSYGMGRWDANGSYSNGMPTSNGMRMSGRRGSRDAYPDYSGTDSRDMETRMRREMNY